VEGEAVGVQVRRVDVESVSDFVAEKRQIQCEPRPEQNPVELLDVSVVEAHLRSVNRRHPRPHRNSSFGDQWEIALIERDTGGEQ
jgi:hypothetical protein